MLSPCIMCVQYIGGCSVHQRDIMIHMGGYREYTGGGGGVQYIGEITMSTSGDTIIHVGEQIDKSL